MPRLLTKLGPSGIVSGGFPAGLHEGAPLDITLKTGERVTGRVLIWDPLRQFAAVAENMDGALVRLELMRCGGPAEACLWLASYGAADPRVREMTDRWNEMLHRILADSPSS